MKAGASLCIKS